MMKARKRRVAFLMVTLLVLALGAMLVGGTFATEISASVVYDEKGPKSPDPGDKFAVDLQYHNGTGYVSMIQPVKVPVLNGSALWCPGRTEIVYLNLTNEEAFPVKCTLTLEVESSTFGNTLSYAVIGQDLKAENANHPANWKKFEEMANGSAILSSKTNAVASHMLLEKQELSLKDATDGKDEYALAVAIHMDEKATSDYEDAEMRLHFKLQVDANHQPGTTAEDL